MAINVNQLARELNKQLQQYTNDVVEQIEKSAKEIGKEGVKKLKETSPKRTGEYADGWRLKQTNEGYVMHNATHYQLTHLLENGHLNRDGSRTAPQPHIAPVEKETIDKFLKATEKAVQGK
ncbi:HK97 gp10 family phage protein [Ureibacillus sp. FSL W8-0352]|uniref:HK97 gp10 family phage protein n=1 Tax=Ureibacillus sp. FSL W8-0352 TaxID=2954596 RepID=UPI0030F81555